MTSMTLEMMTTAPTKWLPANCQAVPCQALLQRSHDLLNSPKRASRPLCKICSTLAMKRNRFRPPRLYLDRPLLDPCHLRWTTVRKHLCTYPRLIAKNYFIKQTISPTFRAQQCHLRSRSRPHHPSVQLLLTMYSHCLMPLSLNTTIRRHPHR